MLNTFQRSLYFVVGFMCTFSAAANALTLSFEDKNLENCVNKIASKKGWKSPESITEIKCHKKDIESLAGLEQLTNLTKLSVYNNNITEIDLSPFKHLKQVNVAKNRLQSLAIENHTFLEDVYAFSNQLTEITIKNLPMLSMFKANTNKVVNFEYDGLKNLEKIYLFNNEIEHIDIYNLPSLKYMDVRQNPMSDELYEEMDRLESVTIWHDGNAEDWN